MASASAPSATDRAPATMRRELERSRQIILAACDLLDEEGLEGLTIRSVLKRTGLARRAFYERFAGKDDLVLAVLEHMLCEAADYFGQLAKELADPLEAIHAIVVSFVLRRFGPNDEDDEAIDRRSAALAREHLRLAEARPAALQAALSPLLDFIAEQIAEGIRQGKLRPCDPNLQATLIYNLVATTVHTELLAPESGNRQRREKLAEDMWEFCRRAIIA